MSLITEFRPLYTVNGASFAILDFPIAATQSFEPGQVLVVNAAMNIREAVDAEVTVMGVAADNALVGGTALAIDQPVSCFLFNDDTVFEANVLTPSTMTSRIVLSAGNEDLFSALFDLDVTAGVHSVNNGVSTDDLFQPVDLDLTAGRKRLHIRGSSDCQWLANCGPVAGTASATPA